MLDFLFRSRRQEPWEEAEEEVLNYDTGKYWEDACKQRDETIADLQEEIEWIKSQSKTEQYELRQKLEILQGKNIDIRIALEKESKKERIRYEKLLAEKEDQIQSLTKDLKNCVHLNSALLRVSIEKANADRGIPNKKAHDGYLVLSGKKDSETFKYILQTPYKASLPYDSIEMQVDQDFKHKDILSGLGCVMEETSEDMSDEEICYLLSWKLLVNAKSGYYEVEGRFSGPLAFQERRMPQH